MDPIIVAALLSPIVALVVGILTQWRARRADVGEYETNEVQTILSAWGEITEALRDEVQRLTEEVSWLREERSELIDKVSALEEEVHGLRLELQEYQNGQPVT